MAFCSATVPHDCVINPNDLVLDESLVKWRNPANRSSHFFYQKLFLTINGEKKHLVFETPKYYSRNGLLKSMNNSEQLFVQLSDAQRISLNVIDQYMITHAKFANELEAVWQRELARNPNLPINEKFRSLYPGNSVYMKLHDDFEAFNSNRLLIDKSELTSGYYRVLFHVAGFQYGEFSSSKPYLCAISMKVHQVVFEARKTGVCYLNDTPLLSPPQFINEHESDDLVNSFLNDIMEMSEQQATSTEHLNKPQSSTQQEQEEKKKRKKSKKRQHSLDVVDVVDLDAESQIVNDSDQEEEEEGEESDVNEDKKKKKVFVKPFALPEVKKRKKMDKQNKA